MPTVSAGGGEQGVGEDKAIAHLEAKGFRLTREWTWVRPSPGYKMADDDWGAIGFLIDEWDFGGLAD